MKICILAHGYPTEKAATCVFVAKLCDEFADLGHQVTVVAPQNVSRIFFRGDSESDTRFVHKTRQGNDVLILRPKVISFGRGCLRNLSRSIFISVVNRTVASIGVQDVYYGHFWFNAFALYPSAKKNNRPLFVASGESTIKFRSNNSSFIDYLTGVIGVSTKNIEESLSLGLTTKEKCILLPNAVDTTEFYMLDKAQCRKELCVDEDLFVVVFAANFSMRKGSQRLAEAIDKCHDDKLGVFFLGRQVENDPQCKGILKKGFVNHQDIVKYMNAADVYVLPTLAEGCCNSIVEAMACGLPIISSNLPFNQDILDEKNSILIDPMDVDQIASAIGLLKNNPALRKSMSEASLNKAKELNLTGRASKIIDFINSKIL